VAEKLRNQNLLYLPTSSN